MNCKRILGGERVCLINDEVELGKEMYRNSGDIVTRDEHGVIYYEGRADDQVKRQGKRVNLQQIEKVKHVKAELGVVIFRLLDL